MEIIFNCPHCKAAIEADSEISGVRAQCPACQEIVLVPAPGIEIGMELSGYRIDKRLGVGGMGEVFEATQIAMKRRVALKVLPPGVTNDPALVNRFLHEVEMAAKLEHHNIVTAFDAGTASGYYYLAMSFVEGYDLDQKLKEGPISEAEAMRVSLKVADALEYAWRRFGMLHRDIKPANIMIDTDGEVKLMDMGIAKTITEDSNLTMQGSLVGTPYYMSPEQATANAQMDCRADIYSLGATVYYLVTGTKPYDGPNAMAIIAKHISGTPDPPKSRYPDLSQGVNDLILKMMAKKPDDRPADWNELVQLVHKVVEGDNGSAAAADDGIPSLRPEPVILDGDEDIGLKPKEEPLHTIEMHGAEEPYPKGVAVAAPPADGTDQAAEADSTPTPTPEKIVPEPQFLKGGAAATDAEGVKVGVFAAAGLGALVFLLLVGAIVWVFMDAQKKKADAEIRRREQELEEARIAADVEKTLHRLDINKMTAAEIAEKRKNLEQMFNDAVKFARENPDKQRQAREDFEYIAQFAEGTPYALRIRRELNELGRTAPKGPSERQVLSRLEDRADRLALENHYGPAAGLIRSYRGPKAEETEIKREDLAQVYAKKARQTEKLAEFVRIVVRQVLKGDLDKAEATIREARASGEFKADAKRFENSVKPIGRVVQLARHTGAQFRNPPPKAFAGDPYLLAFRAIVNGKAENVPSILKREDDELPAMVLIGEAYLSGLRGDWNSNGFKGDDYRGQIKSVKLRLSRDDTFRTSINGKKPVRGHYRVTGNWLYLYHGEHGREYWEVRKIESKRLVLSPKHDVLMQMVRD